jgi:hypothetical protein
MAPVRFSLLSSACCLGLLLAAARCPAGTPVTLTGHVESVQFTSDHGLLRHNTADVLGTGERYPDVQWSAEPSRNAPVTHTAGPAARVFVTVTFTVIGIAPGTPFILTGTCDEPGLCFCAEGRLSPDARTTIAVEANRSLGRGVRKIRQEIMWVLTVIPPGTPRSTILLGTTGPHVIYTTIGTPRHAEQSAGTVTDARMELAIERVAAAQKVVGKSAPTPRLVYELMKQNGAHYLPARHYRREAAWKLPESWRLNPPGASCISIVDFVCLVCDMVGVEGEVQTTAFFALPSQPRQAVSGGLGDEPRFKKGPDGEKWQLFLVDASNNRHGQVGGIGGMNFYEAALRLDFRGKQFFYPGGTDRVFDKPESVLFVFRSLAWAAWDASARDWVVREVVHTYVAPGASYPTSVPLP